MGRFFLAILYLLQKCIVIPRHSVYLEPIYEMYCMKTNCMAVTYCLEESNQETNLYLSVCSSNNSQPHGVPPTLLHSVAKSGLEGIMRRY